MKKEPLHFFSQDGDYKQLQSNEECGPIAAIYARKLTTPEAGNGSLK